MIFCAADTHGYYEWDKLLKLQPYISEEDTLIIAGDAGFVWGKYDDKLWHRLKKEIPCKILCVDGNHENFNKLAALEEVELYGGKAKKVTNQIYYLNRGEIFNIEGKNILVFGGARSIDKNERIENESWWPAEIPSQFDLDKAYAALEFNHCDIHYVISHEWPLTPLMIFKGGYSNLSHENYTLPLHLDNMYKFIHNSPNFKKWIAGHMHLDKSYGKFVGLYSGFEELI